MAATVIDGKAEQVLGKLGPEQRRSPRLPDLGSLSHVAEAFGEGEERSDMVEMRVGENGGDGPPPA